MKTTKPEHLYRYQRFNALSLDALCNDQLFFSDPSAFNDPLDCKPSIDVDSDIYTLRQILKTLMERRVEKEILSSLKASKLEWEHAGTHAKKHAQDATNNALRRIAYNATDPDYDMNRETMECQLLGLEIRAELLKQSNFGICCLSAEYNNPLLWSHYADQHKGFCVGYSLKRKPEPDIQQVQYGGTRSINTSLVAGAILNNDPTAIAQLTNSILLRKASPWSYEKEWRVVDSVGLQDSPLCLEEIIFGLRCSHPVMYSVMAALEPRGVNFYQMYIVGQGFELERTNDIHESCAYLPRVAISGVEAFGPIEPNN